MGAIDTARELGKAIQADPRYIRAVAAQESSDGDQKLQDAIAAFNLLRDQLNAEVQKDERDTEAIKEMDERLKASYQAIMDDAKMKEFSAAREELQEMLTFVNQIITGSTNGQDPDTIDMAEESCGGDCGGCSGCH